MRICAICGGALPAGSPASQKYCPDCHEAAVERWRERSKERNRLRRARERQKQPKIEYTQRDRDYCRKCIYYGSEEYGNNLCDYMLWTGVRRGCRAGYGCTRREVDPDELEE